MVCLFVSLFLLVILWMQYFQYVCKNVLKKRKVSVSISAIQALYLLGIGPIPNSSTFTQNTAGRVDAAMKPVP